MSPTPAPGYNLAPPKVTRESPKFSIPKSILDAPPFPLDSTTFAIKASIGDTEIFSHEQVAPGYEISQSLFFTKLRIASVTKLFTALSILLSDDQIGWEDPITKHVHGLDEEVYGEVTISALASHTSGLGRFGYVGDLGFISTFHPAQFGIPQVYNSLPGCDVMPGSRVATSSEVLDMFNNPAYHPHSPNSGPLYSNIAYNLLGKALENAHSKPFERIVKELILKPLGMAQSTFETPKNDGTAILPKPEDPWFAANFGNFNPTGGIWSTPNEMLLFMQSILHHKLLSPAKTRKWLQPRALLPSLHQLVGAPWEIFRPTDLDVAFERPIDVYTKAGGVAGYAGMGIIVPEYDIAITIHAAATKAAVAVQKLLPLVLSPLVTYADTLARSQASSKYAGTYKDVNSDNHITLAVDGGPGISVASFVMNGVPVLASLAALQGTTPENFTARLYPTDPDSISNHNETWRILLDQLEREEEMAEAHRASWNWGDPYRYVSQPLDTVIFEVEEDIASSIELLGWRVKLKRE